jgi:hypothetical protein
MLARMAGCLLVAGTAAVVALFLAASPAALVLVTYGPERFVPDMVGRAGLAANPLPENRIEAPDPYVGLLAIGPLLAVLLVALTAVTRRGAAGAGPTAPLPFS